VFEHAAPYATRERAAKLAATRSAMHALGATHHFISTLDDIAWQFNLRGADVSFNPVFLAHALIGPQGLRPRCSTEILHRPRRPYRWPLC
jgi:Xaa-Pro aminopeptidase